MRLSIRLPGQSRSWADAALSKVVPRLIVRAQTRYLAYMRDRNEFDERLSRGGGDVELHDRDVGGGRGE